eukprot:CAMPEP_0197652068 /NCGR_PEP_ID=MMETSP1338-20131121/34224_1 /TAXON_ID=43686 ORGANISM="Pelagodinium beii, Strain RCC1491" /NCGR_SAMPLE_ID=MMETSP1338 /ASSEMBLY_ACC=CAM_ASM_000754 /LENGTH=513 /DNA_ID=CAMNT_0043226865 /DNA_START=44 /DNA_END=1585 /DNA_ORIENTATION=+
MSDLSAKMQSHGLQSLSQSPRLGLSDTISARRSLTARGPREVGAAQEGFSPVATTRSVLTGFGERSLSPQLLPKKRDMDHFRDFVENPVGTPHCRMSQFSADMSRSSGVQQALSPSPQPLSARRCLTARADREVRAAQGEFSPGTANGSVLTGFGERSLSPPLLSKNRDVDVSGGFVGNAAGIPRRRISQFSADMHKSSGVQQALSPSPQRCILSARQPVPRRSLMTRGDVTRLESVLSGRGERTVPLRSPFRVRGDGKDYMIRDKASAGVALRDLPHYSMQGKLVSTGGAAVLQRTGRGPGVFSARHWQGKAAKSLLAPSPTQPAVSPRACAELALATVGRANASALQTEKGCTMAKFRLQTPRVAEDISEDQQLDAHYVYRQQQRKHAGCSLRRSNSEPPVSRRDLRMAQYPSEQNPVKCLTAATAVPKASRTWQLFQELSKIRSGVSFPTRRPQTSQSNAKAEMPTVKEKTADLSYPSLLTSARQNQKLASTAEVNPQQILLEKHSLTST